MTDTAQKQVNSTYSGTPVLQYLVREPSVKSTKKKAIILLHGVGSNESDLFSFADQFPNDFYVIAPRGQFTLGAGSYAWYSVDFSTGKPVFNIQQEMSSRNVIKEFIAQMKQKYNIKEIYLGGFSQGAIMSYTIGLTNPNEVHGIIALSGRLLEEVRPLITNSNDLRGMKVFISHGIQDNTLPVHYARDANSFLKNLQVQIRYKEYEMGHQVNEAVLSDLNAWFANQ